MPPSKQPNRPRAWIPTEHIHTLETLVDRGCTQEQIAKYYTEKGYSVSQSTISRRIKEMREEKIE